MAKKAEKEPETDLVKDAVLAFITTKGHVKTVELQHMALPPDAMTDDPRDDVVAIWDAILDLLAEKKIVRKSYGESAGFALPSV